MATSSARSVSRGPISASPDWASSNSSAPPPSRPYGRRYRSNRRSSAASYGLALSSASSWIGLMELPHRLGQRRPIDALEPLAHPAREDQESEAQGDVGEDEPPQKDVDRPQLPRDVGGHHHRREDLADARGAGRGCEVEQEHDQGLQQQNVDEVGVETEGAQRHVPREQLVGVRRAAQNRGPEQRQPPRGAVERHHALVRLIDTLPQPLEPAPESGAPPPNRLGQSVDQVPHQL